MQYFLLFLSFLLSTSISAQSIIGQWVTYDDHSQEKKAVIEIYTQDNLYFAKIVESYDNSKSGFCETCKGEKYGQAIIGLVIIEDLKKDGEEYNEGTILDPDNGEVYNCYVELIEPNKLKVRGYIGISIFGRTQYWLRKE